MKYLLFIVICIPCILASYRPTYRSDENTVDWFDRVKVQWNRRADESAYGKTANYNKYKPKKKMNVLLVIIDDMRADLAVYGHEDAPPTPNIDKFADSARVFRRAYAQFPDCAPSRSSFLTGLRPDRLGIDSHECTTKTPDPSYKCNFRESLPGTVSMPQYFKEAGYISLSYGKVFHQGLDDDLSWSSQEEFNDGYIREDNNAFKNKKWGYEQWFDPLNKGCKARNHTSNCFTEEHSYTAPLRSYIDHKTTTFAIRSIRRLKNESKPWFMAVGLVRPHLPFVCPGTFWDINYDPYENLTKQNLILSDDIHNNHSLTSISLSRLNFTSLNELKKYKYLGHGTSEALHLMGAVSMNGFGEFRDFLPWDIREIRKFAKTETYVDRGVTHSVEQLKSDTRRGYRSCISFVDYEFGRITSALSESGQENNTVVALMSDHGFKLGEFDMWGKHSTLHMDVHVPLLIRHPNMKLPGKQEHQVVELVDVFPTLADLSGVSAKRPLPRVLDGQSLALVVFDPLHAPPLAKQIAIGQYLPYLKSRTCMGYVLIGREYILKRWTPCSHVPKCSLRMLDSVDLHRILNPQHKAIPFSLEHNRNLVVITPRINPSTKQLTSLSPPEKTDIIREPLKPKSSLSSLLETDSISFTTSRTARWIFPQNVTHDIPPTMKMIATWSRDKTRPVSSSSSSSSTTIAETTTAMDASTRSSALTSMRTSFRKHRRSESEAILDHISQLVLSKADKGKR